MKGLDESGKAIDTNIHVQMVYKELESHSSTCKLNWEGLDESGKATDTIIRVQMVYKELESHSSTCKLTCSKKAVIVSHIPSYRTPKRINSTGQT